MRSRILKLGRSPLGHDLHQLVVQWPDFGVLVSRCRFEGFQSVVFNLVHVAQLMRSGSSNACRVARHISKENSETIAFWCAPPHHHDRVH